MGEASSKRLVLETSLRKAVERGEMILQYQPVIDLKTGN
jgi:sensor c-di-GMP phosphodiesterase-like protein